MNKQVRKTGLFETTKLQDNPYLDKIRNDVSYSAIIPYLDFFSTKCVFNTSSRKYHVILANGRMFEETSRSDALERLSIEYSKHVIRNGLAEISSDHVKAYKNFINPVDGFMAAPLCDPIFTWNNGTYVNSFKDHAIVDDSDLTEEDITYFDKYVKAMARGLFGIIDYDMDTNKFFDIVVNKNYPERIDKYPSNEELMYFVFTWISALYNRPGINLSTIPCFFGLPGTGKSTFANIIAKLLGNSNPNLSQKQTNGKFNSSLEGKLFVFYNEVKDYPTFYNDIVKGTLTEETISIERKGIDPYIVMKTVNGMLGSNHEAPFNIDANDRRLVVIKGISEEQNRQSDIKIADMNTILREEDPYLIARIATIFAKIIPYIEVNEKLLNSGAKFITPAKELMMDVYQSPVERFFEDENVRFIKNDPSKTRTQLKRTSIKDLEVLFKEWIAQEDGLGNVTGNYSKTNQSFKNEINKLALKERYVYKDKSSILHFTDSFYDEYMNRDHSETPQQTTSNIAYLAAARLGLKGNK